MKNILTYCLPLIAYLLSLNLSAQDWRWGVRGGAQNNVEETVIDMATDKDGNIYMVSEVGGLLFNTEGQTHPFYGKDYDDRAILIASFACDGTYRWSKMISGYSSSYGSAIATDTLGNVYVSGNIRPGKRVFGTEHLTHFDTDVVIPYSSDPNTYKESLFLIRYDTSGNFEELIMPSPDNVSNLDANNYGAVDLAVDPDGTTHWWIMVDLPTGGKLEGVPASQSFYYILKYDASGNYLGRVELEIDNISPFGTLATFGHGVRFNHDPVSGSYYVAGAAGKIDLNQPMYVGQIEINTTSINGTERGLMFVAKFGMQGNALWTKQAEDTNLLDAAFFGRPEIDTQGNIYLSGYMLSNYDSVGNNLPVEFNGYVAINSVDLGYFPVLFKLHPNGDLAWGIDADTENNALGNFSTLNGNKIVFSGSHVGITWGNQSFPEVSNGGYDIYLAQFDKDNGNFIAMDSLWSSFGFDEYASAIVADNRGNVYVGGAFEDNLFMDNDSLYGVGSNTDFFIAKFGQANCNCVLPEAKFTYSATPGGIVDFTYTGTSGFDELEWGFGNGANAYVTTGMTTYTYSNVNETYWVCVTAYNTCGHDTWCMEVDPNNMGLEQLSKSKFAVYPNPVREHLTVDAVEDLYYKLFSITGKLIRTGTFAKGKSILEMNNLSSGIYMLKLENGVEQERTIKVVKE